MNLICDPFLLPNKNKQVIQLVYPRLSPPSRKNPPFFNFQFFSSLTERKHARKLRSYFWGSKVLRIETSLSKNPRPRKTQSTHGSFCWADLKYLPPTSLKPRKILWSHSLPWCFPRKTKIKAKKRKVYFIHPDSGLGFVKNNKIPAILSFFISFSLSGTLKEKHPRVPHHLFSFMICQVAIGEWRGYLNKVVGAFFYMCKESKGEGVSDM